MSAQILVVEDESGVRQLIKDALSGQGYDIVMCNNALTAKAQLSQSTPDLAIVDWMMPQVSGIELISSMRKNDATGNLPIIMLTARSTENDTIEGLEAGADDYITKPFSPRELNSRVQAALRRSAGHNQNNALQHRNITVHPDAMRVTVDNNQVSLGQTEYKLLHFFISNPDKVFSRKQLLDNVWGINTFVEERTVDVHILRLRKALKSHNVTSPIDTVRGAGYRLAAL